MKRLTLASVAAFALVATAAIAQPGLNAGPREGHSMQRLSKEDRAALFDARMAAVPVGLKLTDEQRKLWEPVEKAIRDNHASRVEFTDAIKARAAEGKRPDFMGRLEHRVERAKDSADRLSSLSEAMKPFWASLSEDQRRLYPVLMRRGGPGHDGHTQHWRGPKPQHGQHASRER